jgi:hypothetical protein
LPETTKFAIEWRQSGAPSTRLQCANAADEKRKAEAERRQQAAAVPQPAMVQ